MRLIKRHFLAITFLSFILVLIFATYRNYGIAWDEKIFFNVGKYYVAKLFDILRIPNNLNLEGFVPTPYHIAGHGVFFDMIIVFSTLFFNTFSYETLHLIRALFALPIFLLVYWITSRFLSKVYGLIALVFLLLFPRFYGDIYVNAVDIPTTLLFVIIIAYFLYCLNAKQTGFKSIVFGVILGIAINQRLLLFYLPVVNAVFLFFLQKNDFKKFILHQLLIFIFLLLTLHLTHPYLLTHPITGLIDIIQGANKYPWNAAVLFDGQFYQAGVKPLPWYYLPKSMFITIPLGIIALFVLGNIALIRKLLIIKTKIPFLSDLGGAQSRRASGRARPPSEKNGIELLSLYLLIIFYLPFIIVLIFKPTLYDVWRHFFFLTVPIIIFAMLGLRWIIHLKSLLIKSLFLLLIGGSLLLTAREMIALHPYEYIYFNSLTGGLKGAYGKHETDYWGMGFKEAVLWFNQNENNPKKTYKILVEGDPLASSYYFKSNMQLTTDVNEADYIFTFTRWNFHLRHPGKIVYMVERDGVPLIFVKKL